MQTRGRCAGGQARVCFVFWYSILTCTTRHADDAQTRRCAEHLSLSRTAEGASAHRRSRLLTENATSPGAGSSRMSYSPAGIGGVWGRSSAEAGLMTGRGRRWNHKQGIVVKFFLNKIQKFLFTAMCQILTPRCLTPIGESQSHFFT